MGDILAISHRSTGASPVVACGEVVLLCWWFVGSHSLLDGLVAITHRYIPVESTGMVTGLPMPIGSSPGDTQEPKQLTTGLVPVEA